MDCNDAWMVSLIWMIWHKFALSLLGFCMWHILKQFLSNMIQATKPILSKTVNHFQFNLKQNDYVSLFFQAWHSVIWDQWDKWHGIVIETLKINNPVLIPY